MPWTIAWILFYYTYNSESQNNSNIVCLFPKFPHKVTFYKEHKDHKHMGIWLAEQGLKSALGANHSRCKSPQEFSHFLIWLTTTSLLKLPPPASETLHYGASSAEPTAGWEADPAANTQQGEGLWGNGQHKPEAVLYLEKRPEWCSQGQAWKPWTAVVGFMLLHHCQRVRARKVTLWSLQSNHSAFQGLPCGKAPDILHPSYSQMHSKEAEDTEYLTEDISDCVSLNRELKVINMYIKSTN